MSDPSPLLAAKTSLPGLRPVPLRSDQLAKLAEAVHARLLLVRAPAGYGKTTLIASAGKELGWTCVWYRLDAQDADPAAFLRSLTEVVKRREAGGQLRTESAMLDGDASPGMLVAQLATELARAQDEQLFIVLDDYDSVEPAQHFDEAVTRLLQLVPPTVHLVVLTRRQPSFATARLELEGGLVEITYRHLLLDSEQIATIVEHQTGVLPTREAIEGLLSLTEGWAAGVVLSAKAAGSDPARLDEILCGHRAEREVFRYLADEVWQRQAAEIRMFLKDTCCLETITLALAEAVSGSPEAPRLLEELETRELLFPVSSGEGMRYHPLFRRFLEGQVLREAGADAFRALQHKSAEALAAQNLFSAAIEVYLTLAEPHAPLELLARHGTQVLEKCSDELLGRWTQALHSSPQGDAGWAALISGGRLFRQGQLASARELLEAAQAALSDDPAGRHLSLRELAQHYYASGRDEEAIKHARKAVEAASDRRQRAESLLALARMLSTMSRWRELDETLAAFGACGHATPELTAKIASLEAHRTYIAGNVRSALAAAERALPLMQRHASRADSASFLNALAMLTLFNGMYEESTEYLARARQECLAHGLETALAETELTRAALLAQQGGTKQALSVLSELDESHHARANAALRFESQALRGTVLRRSGQLERAQQAYEQAQQCVEGDGPLYDRLGVHVDLAFAQHRREPDLGAELQLQRLMDQAAHSRLLFQYAKARFYLALMPGVDDRHAELLLSPCAELLRLGHLDFLGQELAAQPEVLENLVTAATDEDLLSELLATVARQAAGPTLLASLAAASDRAGLLVVEATYRCLSAEQRGLMLAELRTHPSRQVRHRARGLLLSGAEGRLFPELTPREEEVLAGLADGRTNQAIAEQLSLTLATVKTHVHRILRKTSAHGRLAAAVLYQQRSAAGKGSRKRRRADTDRHS